MKTMEMTYAQAIEVAKAKNQTMHGMINSNRDIIFNIYYPQYGIWVLYNELPNTYAYELNGE